MKLSRGALGVHTFCVLALVAGTGAPQRLLAADDTGPAKGDTLETVEVSADKLHVLPTEPIESVFGFGKNIIETPRALTSISNEMLDRVNITDINDLVALSPGVFTQSFFGVAGSLDIRGSAGENYFRGIRRIDNPGNYPQAIAASDRIDIVRGPASPIYGPSKVGGYLNFVPKSARADTGSYLTEAKGEIGSTTGRWDQKTLHAELGDAQRYERSEARRDTRAGHYERKLQNQSWRGSAEDTEAAPADLRDRDYRTLSAA